MCGIIGILDKRAGASIDQATLNKMAGLLSYRGPDDKGVYINHGCGLAHQRLAIIDLSPSGHQPMTTPDGRYTIIFNGEIYNYQTLSKQYLQDIKLRSSSDTEVLLHLLAKMGISALSKLRGMFALALWDKAKQELLLARDPFGKKPLYYADLGHSFIFASETKALLAHPDLPHTVDPIAISKYLLYTYVPAPATGYETIKQLPLGSYARITRQNTDIKKWWQPIFLPKTSFASDAAAIDQLDGLLSQAVKRRQLADVPVGIFLSGGLDSTTIAWYMKQTNTNDLLSFSVYFTEKSYDESSFSQTAATALGTRHHAMYFRAQDVSKTLEELKHFLDIPLADPVLLPTYQLSKFASSLITVALSGEGSDELLAGYNMYRAAEITEHLPSLPRSLWTSLAKIVHLIPTKYEYSTFDSRIKTLLQGIGYSPLMRNQLWISSFSPTELNDILTDPFRAHVGQVLADVTQYTDLAQELAPIDAVSLVNIHHYLNNYLLTKLDRSTMYAGLEARAPFLDIDLTNFLMCLPIHLKRNKYLLKKLMRGRIPSQIIDRRKQGFSLPLGHWLREPLYNWTREVLAPDNLRAADIVKPPVVDRLLTEHRQGKADHRKKIWTLLMLHLWHDQWINHPR